MTALTIASLALMARRSTIDPPDDVEPFTNDGPPTISGLGAVNEILTAQPGIWIDPDSRITSYSYRWQANDQNIPGAVGLIYTVSAAYEGQDITVVETAIAAGGVTGAAQSSPIGPIVLNFPSFAPPYFVGPVALGSGDGSSFANAGSWRQLNIFAQAVSLNGGGEIYMASHLGTYTAATITIAFGGIATTPCIIHGVNGSLVAANAIIQGGRTRPWVVGQPTGSETFKLLRGADYLTFRNIDFRDVGNGCWRVGAPITQLLIEDCPATNVRRLFENTASGTEANAPITGLTIRRCDVHGFSKSCIRVQYASRDILIEGTDDSNRMILDSEHQVGDSFAIGVQFNDTAHAAIVRFVNVYRCLESFADTAYRQGDGMSAESSNDDIHVNNCHIEECNDSAFDFKGGGGVGYSFTDCTFARCGWGFKIWDGNATITRCHGRDPYRIGTGGAYFFNTHLRFAGRGITVIDSSFADTAASGDIVRTVSVAPNPYLGFITLVNTSYDGNRDDYFIETPVNGPPTPVITGIFDQTLPPVNTVLPTYVASGAAPTQLLTAGNGTWTGGAVSYQKQHIRETSLDGPEEYIFGATGNTYTRDAEDDQGVINRVKVFARTAGGHEGVVESAAVASNSAILLGGEPAASFTGFFTELVAEDTVIAAVAVGPDNTGWTTVLTDDGPGSGRVKISGDDLVVGALTTAYADFAEFDITFQSTKSGETTLNSTFTLKVAPAFGATYRFITTTGVGNGSSWGAAAPFSAINTLIAELKVVLEGEAPGVMGHILIREGLYSGLAPRVIGHIGSADHWIEIFGSDLAGNPVGSTDEEISFDNTTPAGDMLPEDRLASIEFGAYDPDSYTTILRGTRAAWTENKVYRYLAGSSGLLDFADGTRVAHYFDRFHNMASGGAVNGTTFRYYAIAGSQSEVGTGTKNGTTLERTAIVRSSEGGVSTGTTKLDFASPPYITIEGISSQSGGKELFSFQTDTSYLKFHHLRFENIGRAPFWLPNNTATVHHIDIENFYAKNVDAFIFFGRFGNSFNDYHDINVRHGHVYGHDGFCIFFRANGHDILVEHVWLDSGRQQRSAFASGFVVGGPAAEFGPGVQDVTYRWCIAQNSHDGIGSGYWNSDGWASALQNDNIVCEDCLSSGNTASGWDMKASNVTYTRCVGMENVENFKTWFGPNVMNDCITQDPRSLGGSGALQNMWGAGSVGCDTTWNDGSIHSAVTNKIVGSQVTANNHVIKGATITVAGDDAAATAVMATNGGEVAIGTGSTINGTAYDDALTTPAFRTTVAKGATGSAVGVIWPQTPTPTLTDEIGLIVGIIDNNTSVLPIMEFTGGGIASDEPQGRWNIVGDLTREGAFSLFWGWRRLPGRMFSTMNWSWPGGGMKMIKVSNYGGCVRTGTPYEGLQITQGTGLVMTSPTTVVSGANRRVLRIWCVGDNLVGTTPAGWTLDTSSLTDQGNDGAIAIDGLSSGAATVPATTRTVATSNEWMCIGLALLPV